MNDTCLIDGFGPIPLVRPGSVDDLGDLVRRAAMDQSALYPVGGGTKLGLGNQPTKPGQAVDLTGLDQVIDFPARDMTITVQAGISIAKLQALLAQENLRLPIDVPQAGRATLGGILAANGSGPRRFGFGTLRDYVIGISAVNDQGIEFKAGGRVVKNVAGYDICKLLVGSLGTLGVITQATLKLRPLAEEQALITLGCDDERMPKLLDQLHETRTRPVCLELLNQKAASTLFAQAKVAAPTTPWVVVVGYEGNGSAVVWQVEQLVKEVGHANQLEAFVGFTAGPLWQSLIDWPLSAPPFITWKAGMVSSQVAAFCRQQENAVLGLAILAHAGNGIVRGHRLENCTREQALDHTRNWRQGNAGGHLTLERCPPDWKKDLQVWGAPPAHSWLMKAVKAKFDPRGLFNPGRFVAGM